MWVTGAGLVITLSLLARLEARCSVRAVPRIVCLRSNDILRFAGVPCFDDRLAEEACLAAVLPVVDSLSSDSSLRVDGADDAGTLSMLLLYRGCCAVIVFDVCRRRSAVIPWVRLGSVLGNSVALSYLSSSFSISFYFFIR